LSPPLFLKEFFKIPDQVTIIGPIVKKYFTQKDISLDKSLALV